MSDESIRIYQQQITLHLTGKGEALVADSRYERRNWYESCHDRVVTIRGCCSTCDATSVVHIHSVHSVSHVRSNLPLA
jgi:hypothetical protein